MVRDNKQPGTPNTIPHASAPMDGDFAIQGKSVIPTPPSQEFQEPQTVLVTQEQLANGESQPIYFIVSTESRPIEMIQTNEASFAKASPITALPVR